MLKYTDIGLPCPTLSISKVPQDFLRSSLPYAKEQRDYSHSYITQAFVIVIDKKKLQKFLKFWVDLNEGIDWFECDFIVGGIPGTKKVRFNTPHKIENLSLDLFRVSTSIEKDIT